MLSMQCIKNITVEDNKKIMNIANFNLYVTRMTQNRNDSLSSILQHGRGSISYFRLSIFDPASQTVQVEGSYDLLSYKD